MSHEQAASGGSIDNVCRKFRASGSCRFGDRCRYEHVDGSGPSDGSPSDVCFMFTDSGSCKWGDSCRFRHGDDDTRDLSPPDPSQRACSQLMRGGDCRYGDECKFSHALTEEQQEIAGEKRAAREARQATRLARNAEGQEDGKRRRPRRDGGQGEGRSRSRKDICFTFRDQGSCEYGETCRFWHGDGDERDLIALRRSPNACWTFRDTGDCKWGEKCRFSHAPDAPDDREGDQGQAQQEHHQQQQ